MFAMDFKGRASFRHSAAAGFLVLITMVTSLVLMPQSAQASMSLQDQIFVDVNAHRANIGLAPLARDPAMEAAAQEHASFMATSGSLVHSTTEFRNTRLPTNWTSHGENIAWGYTAAGSVMNGWMASQGHRANILRPTFTHIGLGYDSRWNTWVQIFASYSTPPSAVSPVTPTVSGTVQQGSVLTALSGAWAPAPVVLSYQWKANGQPISGATGQTLTLSSSQVGMRISVTVTGAKSGHRSGSATSAETFEVLTNRSSTRIAGEDRYAVAVAIAQSAFPSGANTVYVTSGENFPDALSAAPAAILADAPVLLTRPTDLPSEVGTEISRLRPSTIIVVGGEQSVSPDTFAAVERAAGSGEVVRIEGDDRFDVSRNLADASFVRADTAFIANGGNFPDALSAGAPAGMRGSPVVLVDGKAPSVEASTISLFRELGVTRIRIAGGTSSVSGPIGDSLRAQGFVVDRLAGADRYEASASIGSSASTSSSAAFLATGVTFPDALAGSALAGSRSAPLFASATDCVPRAVLARLDSLGVSSVTLLGGQMSLSESVKRLEACSW